MIITRTPFRLSLFGGGTDYPAWYLQHSGLVIGTTFRRYCYLSCRVLPPFFDHKTRIVYSQIESVKEHSEIQHPAVRGCLQYLGVDQGLELHHDGDLPARSGLGSSSSFTVGLLLALHGLRHEMPTKRDLADEAITVEQRVLEEHVGIQDQILAAYGGFQVIEMGPETDYRVAPLVLPPEYQQALQVHILLGFTGMTRFASGVAEEQVRNIGSGQSRVGEILGIAREALRLLHKRAAFEQLGGLLHDGWQLKKSLGKGVSSPDIDAVYETAIRNGAYGGKLLGAGGGGFIMFLAPPERHQRIKDALPRLTVWVPVEFDTEGAQVIFHTDVYQERLAPVGVR